VLRCRAPAAQIRLGQLVVPFRRQVVVGRFTADFLAPRAKLVAAAAAVRRRERGGADARRDRVLPRLGYRVRRLEAELVVRQSPVALQRIREALQEPP